MLDSGYVLDEHGRFTTIYNNRLGHPNISWQDMDKFYNIGLDFSYSTIWRIGLDFIGERNQYA